MKNSILRTIFFFFLLSCCSQLFGNTVIVKGYIQTTGGTAVSGWLVTVATDSANTNCILHHELHTNPNGYYIDTLTCDGDIHGVIISTYNCNGELLIHKEQVTASVIESNFTICIAQLTCNAEFQLSHDSSNLKLIYTKAGVNASEHDSVVSREWNWGDGNITDGNFANAYHQYKDTGSYNICLTVKTKGGCSSTSCQYLRIEGQHQTECVAKFEYNILQVTTDGYGVKFNSSMSESSNGDSIVQRIWHWGDGTVSDGNYIDPTHYYKDTGLYNVCLTIKTKFGCEHYICQYIHIDGRHQTECVAKFEYNILQVTTDGYGVKFNSSMSESSNGDSIVQRIWHWGDGTASDGNYIDPTHYYKDTGSYNVCLTIKTKLGCEHYICQYIHIEGYHQTHCVAKFESNILDGTTNGYGVKFNSNMSEASDGDSIVQRIWHWGDGSGEDGNHVDPTHYYAQPGIYNACLTIKSKGGCSDSICTYIKIESHETTCVAAFGFTLDSMTVKFNSNESHAESEDSIVSRRWSFGDSSILEGNISDPTHHYEHPGVYRVCLTIRSARGCEKTECKEVVIQYEPSYCVPLFTSERIEQNRFRFNSIMSWASPNDKIISRLWNFSDGTFADGNQVDPTHAYDHNSEYNVCLTIKTQNGCEHQLCKTIRVDSVRNEPQIKLITLYPNPVTTELKAIIWSKNDNVKCEIIVMDIYGQVKFSFSKVLTTGNNIIPVYTGNLVVGPYFLKITTSYDSQSRLFFKR